MGFYRHDQWGGCLPCWRDFDNGVFNEGGGLQFQLHVYLSKQYKQSINKLQCSSTWLCCQMMWIVFMWSRFHLQQVNWTWFESEFKFKLQMYSNWSSNLQFTCNILHLNGIPSHIRNIYIKFQPSTMWLCIVLIVVCCLSIEVEPKQEAATFVEDPEPEPRQQGKQPPHWSCQ